MLALISPFQDYVRTGVSPSPSSRNAHFGNVNFRVDIPLSITEVLSPNVITTARDTAPAPLGVDSTNTALLLSSNEEKGQSKLLCTWGSGFSQLVCTVFLVRGCT